MPDQDSNVAAREARVRRAAQKDGQAIQKDRARTYSHDHQGGYMLVDPYNNTITAGQRYDLTLEDLEAVFSGVGA